MKIKRIFIFALIMCLALLFDSCTFYVSKGANEKVNCEEVAYEKPEIKKDTNLGADLPRINYESEHQIIFSHALGIFIYDLDNSRTLRAIKLSDSKVHICAQGDTSAVLLVDYENQIITIYENGAQQLSYYYKYNINEDKLYKYSIEGLDTNVKQPEVTGRMDTTDWTAYNLTYISTLTGKTYYPFRDIIK